MKSQILKSRQHFQDNIFVILPPALRRIDANTFHTKERSTGVDEPIEICEPGQQPGECYAPKNDDLRFRGTISLATAFAASSNIAAVKLAVNENAPGGIQARWPLGMP